MVILRFYHDRRGGGEEEEVVEWEYHSEFNQGGEAVDDIVGYTNQLSVRNDIKLEDRYPNSQCTHSRQNNKNISIEAACHTDATQPKKKTSACRPHK